MTVPADFPRARLSLCMIVRDEAERLGRCLASAAPWVGAIVVVDTGSVDDTVAIAHSFGATVIPFTWCDDFARARNAGLEAATSPWVLVLDADEEWRVDDAAGLAAALESPDIGGYSLRVHNRIAGGVEVVGSVLRLFRRDWPDMRYIGEVHEQLVAIAEQRVRTGALASAYIKHDGYLPEVVAAKGKEARNLALARRLVVSRPDDAHAWYALGLSLPPGDTIERLDAFDRARTLLSAPGARDPGGDFALGLSWHWLGARLALGRNDALKTGLEQALARFPQSPDLRCLSGELRLDAGDFTGAAEDFAACLSPAAAAFTMRLSPGSSSFRARTGLGRAWLNLGKNIEAESVLREALAEAPQDFVSTHKVLGGLLLQRGAWLEAMPLFESALQREPDDALRFNIGWCRYKLERYDEAADILQPLADRPDVQHLLGKAHLEAGRGEEALALLDACGLPAAGLALGWARYLTGQPERAAEVWESWLRAGAADWGTKDTLAMFMFLLQGGRRPGGQPERPAEPLRDMDHWFRLLLRYHRFDDVEQVIKRGPQLGDRLWHALRKRWGVTLASEGFYDAALGLLLEAREVAQEDPDLYYWLGFCALHRQLVDDARGLWETCLQLSPGHSLASQSLSLLK